MRRSARLASNAAADDAAAETPDPQNVCYRKDPDTERKYRVAYLQGEHGKLAYVRGRVNLELTDLPPEMRTLPKLRPNGLYSHVYTRQLNVKELSNDGRTEWYQPMFKQRFTRTNEDGQKEHGVVWYARLGSYWHAAVAAVAAELAMQRQKAGQSREQIEHVEADIVEAARRCAAGHMR